MLTVRTRAGRPCHKDGWRAYPWVMFRRADEPVPSPPAAPTPKAWTFIGRPLRLRCPECGISPVFVPLSRVRSLDDWFRPLDGCPRCGYAYEREQGYWLIAIW